MTFISLGEGQKASLGIEVGGRDRIQVDGEGNIEVEGEPVQTELDPVPVCVCVREREHRKHYYFNAIYRISSKNSALLIIRHPLPNN